VRVLLTGAGGGIGGSIKRMLEANDIEVIALKRDYRGSIPSEVDALICCAGTGVEGDSIDVNLIWPITLFKCVKAKIYVAFSGGGVGGPASLDMPGEYAASKAGLVSYVEYFAKLHPGRQVFAVSPGLTDTRINKKPERGAHPDVPAAFVCRLLSGRYGHLSGSLLAAQRDDLDTMAPMHLRRVGVVPCE
jgi:NAD(P)-dependent dehydrogenase (short-subunit alcohol dehydrogenase family)